MKKTLLFFTLTFSLAAFSQGVGTNGAVTLTSGFSVDLDINAVTNKTTLTLVAPANVWFSVGFVNDFNVGGGMTSGIDVFRTDGSTIVDAVTAGNQLPPSDSSQDWSLVSNTTNGNVRTMVVERDNDTGDSNDFVFSTTAGSFRVIWAHGTSSGYAYHGGNRGATVVSTLSTREVKSLNFNLYPNPSSDGVRVQLPTGVNEAKVKVFDTSGRLISTQSVTSQNNRLNVSNLAQGIYLIRVSSDNQFGAERFIKR